MRHNSLTADFTEGTDKKNIALNIPVRQILDPRDPCNPWKVQVRTYPFMILNDYSELFNRSVLSVLSAVKSSVALFEGYGIYNDETQGSLRSPWATYFRPYGALDPDFRDFLDFPDFP